MKTHLEIEDLNKTFCENDRDLAVLNDINLSVENGEFITILGSSGCGKSTLLRIIAGLEREYSGTVLLDGEPIIKPSLEKGFVFQDHRLLPWLNISENIGFGIPDLQKDKEETIEKYINLVGLNGFEKAYPAQLSGGMSQRAAIARALSNHPKILLMDEPFGALDAMTRINMQEEILRIWEQERTTIIMVTHDIDEAVYLGDRVVVLTNRPGKIRNIVDVNLGRPRDRVSNDFIYEKKKIYYEFFKEVTIPYVYAI